MLLVPSCHTYMSDCRLLWYKMVQFVWHFWGSSHHFFSENPMRILTFIGLLLPCVIVLQIGDLGLSKVKQHTLVSGGVRGTLPWMAPELLSGKSNMVTEKVITLWRYF